ncbi:precorrin-3B synthase [Andreprevotia sp. IGB-42]|uniref:precorrin-3B synthase n=1 Tax=Andreprevotia sp. IGB-42 TaxID=2497473 RepID=UPI001357DEF2|nr:precorrin-3B synthase [Andreprevotia sp. IGB-42]
MNQPAPFHSALVAARVSACPGLLHIVPARDGGLCRIRLPGGVLHAGQARALAAAASLHASGIIEATNRANVQLRGVSAAHEAALVEQLLAAGLGPQDGAGSLNERDNVRNIMLSPLAGRGVGSLLDTRPLAAALLDMLQTTPAFAALSPKFCLLLDGGEALAATRHAHDIWLAALPADGAGPRLALGLAGCPPAAVRDEPPLAIVRPHQVVAVVAALLQAFLQLARPAQHRMREVLAEHPAATVLAHAQLHVDFALGTDPALANWHRAPEATGLRVGIHAQQSDAGMPTCYYVGAQLPLGRIAAADLLQLADISQGTLHFTPWQSVLIPDLSEARAHATQAQLQAMGLLTDPGDPLASLIACAGSTGCGKAQADVKTDALALAGLLARPQAVHLSGCERSCAAAHSARWTLLAVAPARYDLYQHSDQGGFGTCLAQQLTLAQAAAFINAQPARTDSLDA